MEFPPAIRRTTQAGDAEKQQNGAIKAGAPHESPCPATAPFPENPLK